LLGQTTQMQEVEIDETTLQTIAATTHGLYFNAIDTDGLREIYAQINQLEKSEVEVQIFVRYKELAIWGLLPALCFMVIELGLRLTILRTLP